MLAALAALLSSVAKAADAPFKPSSPFGFGWGILYGYQGEPAPEFMSDVRSLGAGCGKVYLYWQQIEPEPGQFDWSALDAFVDQLNSPEEGVIMLFSSSRWAAEHPSTMLPASPAKDLEAYYTFVHETVKHCGGRVRYWQNDIEPNSPAYWSGTKEQYAAQLRVFYRAVKDADPDAQVILGGYDGLFVPPGTTIGGSGPIPPVPGQEHGLAFFEYLLQEAGDAFDLFDLRLYLSPYLIRPRVAYIRQRMRALGCEQPIICGEYGGPGFFDFAENARYAPLATATLQNMAQPDVNGSPRVSQETSRAIAQMYDDMASLAPQTQMFMQGCPPELEAKFRRIQARNLVMQNVFALSAGIKQSFYWQLSPVPNERDDMMMLMFGKFNLLQRAGDSLQRTLSADAFARMTKVLAGVQSVERVPLADNPSIYLFAVDRGVRGPAYVVWDFREPYSGEDAPPVPCAWPLDWKTVHARDALGEAVAAAITDGVVRLPVGVTPVYLTPDAQ